MAPDERHGAVDVVGVDVLHHVRARPVTHDNGAVLQPRPVERGRQAQELGDVCRVALGEHADDGVLLRGELEQLEGLACPHEARLRRRDIDVGDLHLVGVGHELEAREAERGVVAQARLSIGIDGRTVNLLRHDIDARCRQGHVEAVASAAHAEEEAAARDPLRDGRRHRPLQLLHAPKAQPSGVLLCGPHLSLVPRLLPEARPELAELPGEILVVGVQPVVLPQLPLQQLLVVDLVVRYLRILHRQRHCIVPRLGGRRDVDRHPRRCLQDDALHVLLGDGRVDRVPARAGGHLNSHPRGARPLAHVGRVRQEKRPVPVVQQPLALVDPRLLQTPVREAVRPQVVRLRVIHRDEQVLGRCGRARGQRCEYEQADGEGEAIVIWHCSKLCGARSGR